MSWPKYFQLRFCSICTAPQEAPPTSLLLAGAPHPRGRRGRYDVGGACEFGSPCLGAAGSVGGKVRGVGPRSHRGAWGAWKLCGFPRKKEEREESQKPVFQVAGIQGSVLFLTRPGGCPAAVELWISFAGGHCPAPKCGSLIRVNLACGEWVPYLRAHVIGVHILCGNITQDLETWIVLFLLVAAT